MWTKPSQVLSNCAKKPNDVTELMTAGDDTRRLNGDCTVNISGGKIFTFTICNIMGRGTVNYTGGEIVQVMERMVADRLLEYVTDGTIHLNVDPSIDAGLISLYFDTVNGESPFVATEAPETTEAPAETTEAPVETTEAPVETTEEVEETEEEPEKTEAPVETTTAAPAATTEEGGAPVGLIIGIVAAVVVVAAVVFVVTKKKK